MLRYLNTVKYFSINQIFYLFFKNLIRYFSIVILKKKNFLNIKSKRIKFSFFIEKPLLEKLWFIIAVSCTLISIVVFYILLSFKRIKQKNKDKISQLAIENHIHEHEMEHNNVGVS